ncbi:hypothetical protein [Mucilaginibacter koreensis]
MLAIALPPILVQYYHTPIVLIPQFWVMFAFYAVLTLVLVTTIAIGQGWGGGSGAQFFLIFTTIKLLACMGYALYYLNTHRVNSIEFVVCFFYLYLLNTLFEIYALLTNLRLQNKT